MLWVLLIAGSVYTYITLRRALGESPERAADRVLAEAERLTGAAPRGSRRWLRPVIATVLCWIGVTATLGAVAPAAAVWVGGLVVVVGAAGVIASSPDPTKIDDDEFERELRALLEQDRSGG
jgi:peptidoglycan/LPS O-acetylase OafA/YrhL